MYVNTIIMRTCTYYTTCDYYYVFFFIATSAEGDLDGYSKKVLPSLQLKVQQPPKDKVEENGTPECSISMEEVQLYSPYIYT